MSDIIEDGDSYLIENILSSPIDISSIFDNLKSEVIFQTMSHKGGEVPRLISIQGNINNDGSYPIYRHPVDEFIKLAPFSPTVLFIKESLEQRFNQSLNHVLIQYYRNGYDYISEHSDKTLDILKDSNIYNVSFGASRYMTLRSKKSLPLHTDEPLQQSTSDTHINTTDNKRIINKVKLTNNSVFVLGWRTNQRYSHGIKRDKRQVSEKTIDELAYNSERISLTFRSIATYMHPSGALYGQGAVLKSSPYEHPLTNNISTSTSTGNVEGETLKTGAILDSELPPIHTNTTINLQIATAITNKYDTIVGVSEREREKERKLLFEAFGEENLRYDFDWEAYYGRGFNVLY